MANNIESSIISYLGNHPERSSKDIFDGIGTDLSYATVKRHLAKLIAENKIIVQGQKKSAKYSVSPTYKVFVPIDLDAYFLNEIDDREIIDSYNFNLLNTLSGIPLFTESEHQKLTELQKQFTNNISHLSKAEYSKEMERLAIDLSWKSSQIEGNTYSLLETERLLTEKKTAAGKTKDEAVMLLNHKEAIDFLVENPDYLQPLSVGKIENIHSILIQELAVDRNIRNRRVGITGTNYRPLDNEFQIREALEGVCQAVNDRQDIFEKALLLLVLISYIQPFNDGNKRTARIVSNAELMANRYCPISFRTVDSIDYKKAMLLFYEQNNISAFKQIFIEQFEFAVTTYF
ncbi:Fic family protein [Alistipes sp. OttesenSCG-928-B03]|nr:Fic family protein [Alistipes sp. OttesenSCG-928-B03]